MTIEFWGGLVVGRGFAHENLTREKLSPTKSKKMVQPLLLKRSSLVLL
jgi:hypothetical protein